MKSGTDPWLNAFIPTSFWSRLVPLHSNTWQCSDSLCAQELCGLLGPCSLSSAALYHHTWECKDCRSMLARTAEYLAQEDTLTKVVSLLQGPCFCGEGEIIECDSLVTTITPMALPLLAHSLTSLSDRHCREVLAVC